MQTSDPYTSDTQCESQLDSLEAGLTSEDEHVAGAAVRETLDIVPPPLGGPGPTLVQPKATT